jgi:hypothetical protein
MQELPSRSAGFIPLRCIALSLNALVSELRKNDELVFREMIATMAASPFPSVHPSIQPSSSRRHLRWIGPKRASTAEVRRVESPPLTATEVLKFIAWLRGARVRTSVSVVPWVLVPSCFLGKSECCGYKWQILRSRILQNYQLQKRRSPIVWNLGNLAVPLRSRGIAIDPLSPCLAHQLLFLLGVGRR